MPGDMRVLVRAQGEKRQIAGLAGSRLMAYLEEPRGAGSLVGTVVLGLVERVLPELGAAFVKIGQPLNGFLPLKEMDSAEQSGNLKPLVTGAEVIVQVKKDPKDEKGAFLTRDIALPGLYCIWMPLNHHVGVSSRVTDEAERARLLDMGRALAGKNGGIIMRQAALEASLEDVREEKETLEALWTSILGKCAHHKPPCALHQEPSALTAFLRDHAARYDLSVYADKEAFQAELPSTDMAFTLQTPIEMEGLWQGARAQEQLSEALRRKVELPGGGTLVIDEREALTTLDVNTARFTGEGKGESIALAQNLAACGEIARQIRLRNLSGILLIDFVDMDTEEERAKVEQTLKEQLLADPAKTVIHGFTRLGFLEMTRKRSRESLRQMLTEPCTACHETGRRPRSPKTPKGKEPKK